MGKKRNVQSLAPKTSTKQTRIKRSLRNIVEVPLDVLFEIFTFVEPADLIRLSRTNKQLRTYLTTRSSSWIWRKSRVNAGDIPKIYPSITEIQFAYLLFEPLCSVRILFTSDSLRVATNKSSSFANRRKSSMSFGLALFAVARTVWLKSAFLRRIFESNMDL
ncbi:hypothetical protein BT96DRAFT_827474 [Gymnopus androsaceus JB14]|uniref:F-box domain-containing protein n=1 Tax=Gymnopus androsaceus JB14 TaxID=1447944 RepID=A0A6A4HBX2_9AGAR|nr:hypothetical protein BT96DRAFT_827474 [Gymnopus androsaceus JB14]